MQIHKIMPSNKYLSNCNNDLKPAKMKRKNYFNFILHRANLSKKLLLYTFNLVFTNLNNDWPNS
jgi:hypothetical protein